MSKINKLIAKLPGCLLYFIAKETFNSERRTKRVCGLSDISFANTQQTSFSLRLFLPLLFRIHTTHTPTSSVISNLFSYSNWAQHQLNHCRLGLYLKHSNWYTGLVCIQFWSNHFYYIIIHLIEIWQLSSFSYG